VSSAEGTPLDPSDPPLDPPVVLPIDGLTLELGARTMSWSDGCDDYTTSIRWEASDTFQGSRLPGYVLALGLTTSAGLPCPPGIQRNDTLVKLFGLDRVATFAGPTDTTITLFGNRVALTMVADP
jgi:hypothetical protein